MLIEVDSNIVAGGEEMKSEKKEEQQEKEVESAKLSIWHTSKSHGYNGFSLMCRSNRSSLFN